MLWGINNSPTTPTFITLKKVMRMGVWLDFKKIYKINCERENTGRKWHFYEFFIPLYKKCYLQVKLLKATCIIGLTSGKGDGK